MPTAVLFPSGVDVSLRRHEKIMVAPPQLYIPTDGQPLLYLPQSSEAGVDVIDSGGQGFYLRFLHVILPKVDQVVIRYKHSSTTIPGCDPAQVNFLFGPIDVFRGHTMGELLAQPLLQGIGDQILNMHIEADNALMAVARGQS